jgi:hypothetical protein
MRAMKGKGKPSHISAQKVDLVSRIRQRQSLFREYLLHSAP